jgi:uncharacterized integral membrane protein
MYARVLLCVVMIMTFILGVLLAVLIITRKYLHQRRPSCGKSKKVL